MITDFQRAERYKRKLGDLMTAANNLCFKLPLAQLSPEQKPLAMALADEAYLIRQQLDNEAKFSEKEGTK